MKLSWQRPHMNNTYLIDITAIIFSSCASLSHSEYYLCVANWQLSALEWLFEIFRWTLLSFAIDYSFIEWQMRHGQEDAKGQLQRLPHVYIDIYIYAYVLYKYYFIFQAHSSRSECHSIPNQYMEYLLVSTQSSLVKLKVQWNVDFNVCSVFSCLHIEYSPIMFSAILYWLSSKVGKQLSLQWSHATNINSNPAKSRALCQSGTVD